MGYNSIQGVYVFWRQHTCLQSWRACSHAFKVQEEFSQRYNAGCVRSARLETLKDPEIQTWSSRRGWVDGDPWQTHNAKVYEQNRLDAIQKQEKRICNYGCILGSVMQQPSVAYAIHDVYMTIMSIPWWVASWLPRSGSDEGGKMHMQGVWAYMHMAACCYPFHTRVRSNRHYELTSLRAYAAQGSERASSDINKPARALSSGVLLHIGFTCIRSNVKCVWYTPRSGNL
jgi:hypothetical protein